VGAILSIFLASAIYFYLQGGLEKRKFLLLAGLAVILALIFTARMSSQKQHLQPVFSVVTRLKYWQDTLRIICSSPFIGVGLGNFSLPESRYAHNSYLQTWAEMGILGLVSFLWLIFSVFKQALGRIKNSVYKTQILILISASAVFLMHNFVDFSFFLPEVALIWWVILGLLFSYANS
jgi:putative inorganic carbon (HCO3(-)) transporter